VKKEELKKVFSLFNQFNILVIGDVMIDSYMWGKVERISPEAPIPVVSVTKKENRLGGAANVALNVKALGANPIICSVIGNDDKGNEFLQLLNNHGLPTNGMLQNNDRITTVKTRVISSNQHLLRVDEETDKNINIEIEAEFIAKIENIINTEKIHAIIFEDYDKGAITPLLIQKIVALANQNKIPTLVDPKKRNFNYYQNVTLFKPNFKELVEGLKLDIKKSDNEEIKKAAQRIQNEWNIGNVLITLSELGVFISNGKTTHNLPAEIRDIADVSGAGDTLISTATLCMAANLSIFDIATISNMAGGLVCEKVGVVPIDKQLLLNECLKISE